jgi:cytochrome b561
VTTADRAAPRTYDGVWMTLHWVVVALVAIQFCTKLIRPGSFPGASEDALNAWHLAIGPTILLLMLIRLGWRLTHTPPPPPQSIAPPLRILSRATHWAFYGLLILIPVLGWVSASGFGVHPMLLGLFALPLIAPHSKSLAEAWGSVHGDLAWALLAVIALHICGALYHLLVKHDGVASRMLPVRQSERP